MAKTDKSGIIRDDGWLNVFSKVKQTIMGTPQTPGASGLTTVALPRGTVEQLYRETGFGRRIIDLPAYEMTREWFEIPADEDGDVSQALETLHAEKKFQELIKWGDLYGGAIMIIGIDDGGTLEMPVNEKNVKNIFFLRVYDKEQVSWTTSDLYEDPEHPLFGQVQFYTVQPYSGGESYRVHESRVVRYDGADLPGTLKHSNNGWGDSVFQSIFTELKNLGVVSDSSANIVSDFVQIIVNVSNLSQMVSAGQEELIKKRLAIMDLGRSVMKTILLDGEEKYTKEASSVAGLPELFDRFMIMLSGVTGIPATKLFGRSPAGQNSTGESDIKNWYDEIKSRQRIKLTPALERLCKLIMIAKDMGLGKELKDWSIEYRPLWQMSEKEEADWKKSVAETDKIYIEQGVVDPSEVSASRFGGAKYSSDTQLDDARRVKGQLKPPPESKENDDPTSGV